MVKEIPLTKGYVALVDDEDFERVSAFKWQALELSRTDGSKRVYGYRCPPTPDRKSSVAVFLHRFILNAPKGVYVDHRDHDGLNCTRSNIRLCTQSQNMGNLRRSNTNTSGYKGVSFDKRAGRYRAQISRKNRTVFIGYSDDPIFAAHMYDAAARHLHGSFALTNFQESNPDAEAIIAARFARDERMAA
jgi:hypothetical protein